MLRAESRSKIVAICLKILNILPSDAPALHVKKRSSLDENPLA